ncbi:MAG: hypothetical protein ACI9BH_003265, partial [Paracoccaceae bacterium]
MFEMPDVKTGVSYTIRATRQRNGPPGKSYFS